MNDPDLADDAKTRTIAKMDKFEKNFRENIGRQRTSFISALQNFIDNTTTSQEEETRFIKRRIGGYAARLTCLLLTTLEESKNNLIQSISKEVP